MCQRNRLSPVCPEEKLVMDATANNCPELFLRRTLERLSYRDLLMSSYRWEARRISGARYQRVATYSVKLGSPCWSTVICESERARPKSHIFTKQSPSSRTFDGYTDIQSHSCNFSDTENISITSRKRKGSPYSTAERRVPELIPALGSQPADEVSHKSGSRLPLLFARPAVTLTTLKRPELPILLLGEQKHDGCEQLV